MALEAGTAMHEVFAVVKCWQLGEQRLPDHGFAAGVRVFGKDRWETICRSVSHTAQLDKRDYVLTMCYEALHTSAWADDPEDPNRTMANMELCAITYVDNYLDSMHEFDIWVHNRRDPLAPIGIEQVFDVVLVFEDQYIVRYGGTIDALFNRMRDSRKVLGEGKTASRIDKGYRDSFDMRHQVTGYCAASPTVFGGEPIGLCRVTVTKIKPTNRADDYWSQIVRERTEEDFQRWAQWVRWGATQFEKYKDDYEHAERFTHACNRYFRPCSLLPFCSGSSMDRREHWHEMIPAAKSPTELSVEALYRE